MVSYSLDTSVVTRLGSKPEVDAALTEVIDEGEAIGRCSIVDLEFCSSAKNAEQWDHRFGLLNEFDPSHDVTQDHLRLALRMQRDLAQAGLSGRKIPDLIIAAVAITSETTLLHYDRDFEHIANVAPLQHRWIVAPGSVD